MASGRGKPQADAASDKAGADPGRRAWSFMLEFMPQLKSHFTALAAAFDLTPPQAFALRRLLPGESEPMSRLAEALGCDASNVTGIVDKLEARGFIERQAAPGDRRVKAIALTVAGVKLRERFLAQAAEPLPAISALSPADQRQLAQIFEKLIAATPRPA